MLPLHRDPWFTFHFADDRIIPRFHLEGVPRGSQVSVFEIDPESGERQGLIASATVGAEGWVDLLQPIIVKAGEAFIAVPDTPSKAAFRQAAFLESLTRSAWAEIIVVQLFVQFLVAVNDSHATLYLYLRWEPLAAFAHRLESNRSCSCSLMAHRLSCLKWQSDDLSWTRFHDVA